MYTQPCDSNEWRVQHAHPSKPDYFGRVFAMTARKEEYGRKKKGQQGPSSEMGLEVRSQRNPDRTLTGQGARESGCPGRAKRGSQREMDGTPGTR